MHSHTARRLLLSCLVLACVVNVGCASLGWHKDLPDFRFQKLEWNVVEPKNLRAVCGLPLSWRGEACAVRIIEGGQCVVFSIHTQEQARFQISATETLEQHELKHCGIGMPSHGGWSHQ